MEAKKSFLDSLSIPVGVVRGVVGTLEVKLSASSIFSNEPLKLRVRVVFPSNVKAEDICLVIEPIDDYSIEDSIRNYYVEHFHLLNCRMPKLRRFRLLKFVASCKKHSWQKKREVKMKGVISGRF